MFNSTVGTIDLLLARISDEDVRRKIDKALQIGEMRQRSRFQVQIDTENHMLRDIDLTLVPMRIEEESDSVSALLSLYGVMHIKEIERFKARFVADAIHDLATPITGLSTRLYLLKRNPKNLNAHIGALENQVKHLRNLLEDLRTLSRLDRRQLDLVLGFFDVNEIAQRVFDTYEPVAMSKQQVLTLTVAPEIPKILMDARSNVCWSIWWQMRSITLLPTGLFVFLQPLRTST